jgi:tripartite-type tricarboxylate transporter receptor subunit TctC
VDPLVDTPAEFAAYLKSDIIKWARVVKEAKIPQQ